MANLIIESSNIRFSFEKEINLMIAVKLRIDEMASPIEVIPVKPIIEN
tara:strand:+ start:403 stop:546 length:144 start_codon:yes stop_codon:yes gene_type:complete